MKNNQVNIAALIINWNGATDTIELLNSLKECQSDSLTITAIIIDNSSEKSDLERLTNSISDLNSILNCFLRVNKINIGVPAAYNQAIQIAGLNYDYYLRLDNDVIIEKHNLKKMIDALDNNAHHGIEIVGGNIKYYHNRNENNCGAVTIDLLKGKTKISYPAINTECDSILGCIMLLSNKLVNNYSPNVFENNLFICTDESELSMRAFKDGIKTLYIPETVGYHKSGQSTGKVNFVSNYYSARNWTFHRLRYVKNKTALILVLLLLPFDIARSIVKCRFSYPLGVVSGIFLTINWFIDKSVKQNKC